MKEIAAPLRLGIMGDDRFQLDRDFWRTHFNKVIETTRRESPGAAITVKKLRQSIDNPPKVWGLPVEAENLIILTFAGLVNYSFVEFGGPAQASTDALKNDWELRAVNLPTAEDWAEARPRANTIFGEPSPQMLNASNVDSMATKLVAIAEVARGACDLYHKSLETNLKRLGINPDSSARMKTARAVLALTHALGGSRGAKAIETVAHAEIATSLEAMGTSFRKAPELHTVLDHVRWDLFDILERVDGERKGGAQAVLANLKEALESDELAVGLAASINELEGNAIKLLAPPPPPPTPPPIGHKPIAPRVNGFGSGRKADLTLAAAQEVFREIEQTLRDQKDARLDLTWILHKGAANS